MTIKCFIAKFAYMWQTVFSDFYDNNLIYSDLNGEIENLQVRTELFYFVKQTKIAMFGPDNSLQLSLEFSNQRRINELAGI